MHRGYIKLWRKLRDNPLWLAEPFTHGQAWVDLLMLANHKPNTVMIRGISVQVQPGEILAGEQYLADRWKWSRGKVRRFLRKLEGKTVQQIVQQKNNVCTVVSITNWSDYQDNGTADGTASSTTDGQQKNNRRTTDGHTEECINTTSMTEHENSNTPPKPPRGPVCPYGEIQAEWNRLCVESGLPQCQMMNADRKRKVTKYWKQEWFRLNWSRIFEAFHADRWRRENRQHSTFDVMFQKQNPEKFYEVQAESAKKSTGTVAMIQYIGTDGNKHNKYGRSPEALAEEMTGHGYSPDDDGIWCKSTHTWQEA